MIEENTTALITVNPQADVAVIALYEQALGLKRCADALTIASDADVMDATNDLSIISNLKKAIEEKRKFYVQPITEHIKDVNEAFKSFTEPINYADTTTRQKILDYRAEQGRIRQEQEEINRLRTEAAQKEMELKGELTESVNLVETQPDQPQHYRTGMGTLGTMLTWHFEVINFALVPDEYKLLDAAKLGKVIRAGLRSIPGIRIYSEETLRVTTKKINND